MYVASGEAGQGGSSHVAQGPDAAKAINSALAKASVGCVRLLPGVYPLTEPLVIQHYHLTLCGSTGVTLLAATTTAPLIRIAASHMAVRDVMINGAVPGTGSPKTGGGAACGVSIEGAVACVLVDNVVVSNVSGSAISAVINVANAPKGGSQTGITVRGCVIDRCGMGGIGLAKRAGPVGIPSLAIYSSGHLVIGNRISRTGSHAIYLTGTSSSQVIANHLTHVSLYNVLGVFGHGIAIDGNCGNDPVETVIITSNIIDTVHTPANKMNACYVLGLIQNDCDRNTNVCGCCIHDTPANKMNACCNRLG